jgi:autotransporter passenger strand-loop-strand repeat protein
MLSEDDIESGAVLEIGSGFEMIPFTIGSGVILEVLSGGKADGMTVSGGTEIISSGGTANNTAVDSGGTLMLRGGTIASDAIVETLSGGTAFVSGTVTNSGTLFASGSLSLVQITSGAVVNGGAVKIGNGTIEIQGSGSEIVTFQAGGTGGLQLDDAIAYSGSVSGFGQNTHQFIDLSQITSNSSVSLIYTPNSSHPTSSGVLTVSSGGPAVASIDLIGHYVTSDFHVSSGASGSVEIVDPPVVPGGWQSPNIALFGNYIAGSFVTAAGGAGGSLASPTSDSQPPLLTHPHA